jgi:hypothetical protein
VQYHDDPDAEPVRWQATGTPTYAGLPLDKYLRYVPTLQPVPNRWRARWNKLTLALGGYWKKCAFCDVHLDYVRRYDPASVDVILTRIRRLIEETGETGLHFVDEAMPPALLRSLARCITEERLDVTWWGNVRFDRSLAPMALELAAGGCLRLTGGLEVASDRLLALMTKGITLAQVAQVTSALYRAGIDVHAYLIYGFPTQTDQATNDALEVVRQLMPCGWVTSIAWHRFALTAHSPVAANPSAFGVRIAQDPGNPFAHYVLRYEELPPRDHRRFSKGLQRSGEAYMHQVGFDLPLARWFEFPVPETTIPPDFVRSLALEDGQVSLPVDRSGA